MRGDSEKAQANLEKMLASQSSGVKRLEKQFKRLRVSNIKEINRTKAAVKSLTDGWDSATDAEKKQLPILNRTIREHERANAAILRLADSTERATSFTSQLSRAFQASVNSIRQYLSIGGFLRGMVEGLIGLYQNWWRLQGEMTRATGEATMALGSTAEQMGALRDAATSMQDMFFDVDGAVDGIAITMQHATEVASALRESLNSVSQDTVRDITVMGRTLAGSTENATRLFRIIESGALGAGDNLNEMGARMMDFASDIGANPAQMMQDFGDLSGELTRFGSNGEAVFHDMAEMANQFGFETRRIFDMMQGFDTFQGASRNVNQLNAMLGTTLSSYEMMMETNPAERLEMIREQISSTGMQWGELGYNAQAAIQEMLGINGNEAAQIFNNNMSLDQMREQQASAERERQQRQTNIENAQMRMARLFNRTATIVRGWREQIELIYNRVSQALAPIFKVLHDQAESIWHEISGWVSSMNDGEGATSWIRTAANWLNEMINNARKQWPQIWTQVVNTWQQWQPYIVQARNWIGQMINRVSQVNWVGMWNSLVETWNTWSQRINTVKNAINVVIKTVRQLWNAAQPTFDRIGSAISMMVGGARQIWHAFQRIIGVVRSMGQVIQQTSGIGMIVDLVRGRQEAPEGRESTRGRQESGGFFSNVASAVGSLFGSPAADVANSAVRSSPSVQETIQRAENVENAVTRTAVEFRNLPVQLMWNGREFARGQIEAALRNT